jgi:hypothetical protein
LFLSLFLFLITPQPNSIHAANAPDREEEQRRAVDAFASAVERMAAATQKRELSLDELRRSSAAFYEHLARLDTCATLEELAVRKREFEREFGGTLRADPAPAAVLVKRGRGGADESESWGKGKEPGMFHFKYTV